MEKMCISDLFLSSIVHRNILHSLFEFRVTEIIVILLCLDSLLKTTCNMKYTKCLYTGRNTAK